MLRHRAYASRRRSLDGYREFGIGTADIPDDVEDHSVQIGCIDDGEGGVATAAGDAQHHSTMFCVELGVGAGAETEVGSRGQGLECDLENGVRRDAERGCTYDVLAISGNGSGDGHGLSLWRGRKQDCYQTEKRCKDGLFHTISPPQGRIGPMMALRLGACQ